MSVEAPIRPSDKKQYKDKNNAPGIKSFSEGELEVWPRYARIWDGFAPKIHVTHDYLDNRFDAII